MTCPACRSAWADSPYCPECGYGGGKTQGAPDRYRDLARISELERREKSIVLVVRATLEALYGAERLLNDYQHGYVVLDETREGVRNQIRDSQSALRDFLNN